MSIPARTSDMLGLLPSAGAWVVAAEVALLGGFVGATLLFAVDVDVLGADVADADVVCDEDDESFELLEHAERISGMAAIAVTIPTVEMYLRIASCLLETD